MNRFVKGSLILALAGPIAVRAAPAPPRPVSPLKSVERMLLGGHRVPLTRQERGAAPGEAPAEGPAPATPVPPAVPEVATPASPRPPAIEPPPPPQEAGAAPQPAAAAEAGTSPARRKGAADIPSGVVTVQSVGDVKQLGEALKRATRQMNRNDGE